MFLVPGCFYSMCLDGPFLTAPLGQHCLPCDAVPVSCQLTQLQPLASHRRITFVLRLFALCQLRFFLFQGLHGGQLLIPKQFPQFLNYSIIQFQFRPVGCHKIFPLSAFQIFPVNGLGLKILTQQPKLTVYIFQPLLHCFQLCLALLIGGRQVSQRIFTRTIFCPNIPVTHGWIINVPFIVWRI